MAELKTVNVKEVLNVGADEIDASVKLVKTVLMQLDAHGITEPQDRNTAFNGAVSIIMSKRKDKRSPTYRDREAPTPQAQLTPVTMQAQAIPMQEAQQITTPITPPTQQAPITNAIQAKQEFKKRINEQYTTEEKQYAFRMANKLKRHYYDQWSISLEWIYENFKYDIKALTMLCDITKYFWIDATQNKLVKSKYKLDFFKPMTTQDVEAQYNDTHVVRGVDIEDDAQDTMNEEAYYNR